MTGLIPPTSSTSSGARVRLDLEGVSIADAWAVAVDGAVVEVSDGVVERARAAHAVVERAVTGSQLVYGLNTGLGSLRNEAVSLEELADYQERIVTAHGGGVGLPLPEVDVRALMLARVAGMARGGSGAHPDALLTLVAMLNAGVHPVVPTIGSVGASDLMHMAAVAQVAVGRGLAVYRGEVLEGGEALERAAIAPYRMRPKDGLALISANGASVGLGALAVVAAEKVSVLADLAGAMSLQLYGGNVSPFGEEVASAKPVPGQIDAAAHMRQLLADSFLQGPDASRSVQDPLSFRVIPQVHGAVREQVAFARRAVEIELNAADDNPFVSVAQDTLLSNGNFHPMMLALAFEALRVGLAHVGMLSERRMNKVIALRADHGKATLRAVVMSSARSPLSTYIAYAGAAIVADLKHLAGPVTLGCPPLDLDVEDHATLAPQAVALTRASLQQLETLLAIEILLAVDARMVSASTTRLGTPTWLAAEAVHEAIASCGPNAGAAHTVEAVRLRLLELVGAL